LNTKIAEGKRKGESYSPALSLQDVFSDPENSPGFHQKTSCLFISEQGIWRNLEKERRIIKLHLKNEE